MYVCVKGEFHNSADDLVDMYHVLLSCLDYVFANAFMGRRMDLINPAFKGTILFIIKNYSINNK